MTEDGRRPARLRRVGIENDDGVVERNHTGQKSLRGPLPPSVCSIDWLVG